jgi:hypothetical protein
MRGRPKKNVRDRSCRLRCSLLLNALLQNWHLYFFSGARDDFRVLAGAAEGTAETLAGMVQAG